MSVKAKKTKRKSGKKPAKKQSVRRSRDALQRVSTAPNTPTISLCMIVRDAAQNLALCLDSVKNVVDEIIIVDTGSQDNTVALAKKYTDKVYFFKWRNDFAAARNESLKHATKDWILVLDDDEALTRGSARTIKRFLAAQPPHCNVYTVWIYDCQRADAEKEIWQKQKFKGFDGHTAGRLLRNHQKLKYRNALHEVITEKDAQTLYRSKVSILHYGYHSDNAERYARNFKIMQESLAKKPQDLICQYNFTRSLSLVSADLAELVKNMDKTLALYIKNKKHIKYMPLAVVYKTFIDLLVNKKAYAPAEKYCYAWLSRLQDSYDLWPYLYLGKILFHQNKQAEAWRMLDLVYKKSRNGLPFCGDREMQEFTGELYYFYGAACVLKGERKFGLKLLRTVQKKYFTNYAVEELIALAGQANKDA